MDLEGYIVGPRSSQSQLMLSTTERLSITCYSGPLDPNNPNYWRESAYPIDVSSLTLSSFADFFSIILQADVLLGIPEKRLRDSILNAAIIMDELWFSRNKIIH